MAPRGCYSGICYLSSMRGSYALLIAEPALSRALPYELLNSKHEVVSMGGIDGAPARLGLLRYR